MNCFITRCLFILFISFKIAYAESNVWDVLRAQLSLNHEVTQPEVAEQIRWLSAHPSYLQKVARQSEPYIYHILKEIKQRGLPGELALIPIIESAFDPFAYSGAGAAGLWQIMPNTGSELGLKQDWWFDGRRSIRPSTDAALNYLEYLNKFFNGNWILAVAAYDAGEGTLARVIKNTQRPGRPINFWTLPLPRETKAYIPRLLALAEIIKYPTRYKVVLPSIPYYPYFQEVNIGSQIDLNHAAKLAGISYNQMIKLNPGYNRWTTAPNQPHKLLIPLEKVQRFNRNLANLPKEKRTSFKRYKVQKRETLSQIARRNHTTENLIQKLNNLKKSSVRPGQYLLIPITNTEVAINKKRSFDKNKKPKPLELQKKRVIHIVQSMETYQHLEKLYGVLASEIRAWNKLAKSKPLVKGQQLVILKKQKSVA